MAGLHDFIHTPRIGYLSMEIALRSDIPTYSGGLGVLAAGVDVWLNTLLRPLEVSGTSGMKAAFNGVPSLSVLDGWWIEGCIEGVTGWAVGDSADDSNGDEATALYNKLAQVVSPLYYYAERTKWIAVMKGGISKNASCFNSHCMMRRYFTEAYVPRRNALCRILTQKAWTFRKATCIAMARAVVWDGWRNGGFGMHPKPSHPEPDETLACEVCLAEIPRSVALSQEATDYVHYFCGVSCYAEWRQDQPSAAPADAPPAKR